MLSAHDRSNLTCELNPKLRWATRNLTPLVPFLIFLILAPPLTNQLFPSAEQLRKTKLRNRPTSIKSSEIIGNVKRNIVCDSGEIISTNFPENISLTVGTDRSPPSYTMYYSMCASVVWAIYSWTLITRTLINRMYDYPFHFQCKVYFPPFFYSFYDVRLIILKNQQWFLLLYMFRYLHWADKFIEKRLPTVHVYEY